VLFTFSLGDTMQDTDSTEASARLTAAAPDLLAACKAALDNLTPRYAIGPMYPADYRVLQQLRAAIAKVNGQPVPA
jgi:hypothetical protein